MEYDVDYLKTLLKSITPKEGKPCAYCGFLSTDREHVTPVNWIMKMRELKLMGFIDVRIPKIVIVPACKECNGIAGDRYFDSFQKKKEYIRDKLRQKWKKYVNMKIWSDKEINELSGSLKTFVFFQNEIAKKIKRRFKKLNE